MTELEAHRSKNGIGLMVIIGLVLLLIPTISAATFDNTKNHINDGTKYGKINIRNNFGLTQLAEYRLTNVDSSVINAWAEGTATLYSSTDLFEDLLFKDNQGQEKQVKSFTILIKTTEQINRTESFINETTTSSTANGSTIYTPHYLNRTISENTTYWKTYHFGDILPAGTYEWRIEARRSINDKVDFILKGQGKEFTEWAWWDTSFTYCRNMNYTFTSTQNNAIFYANITYNANMQTDFDDVRFVNQTCGDDGYEMPYIQDTVVNSNSEGVYIRVNATSGVNQFSMYYGNAIATKGTRPDLFADIVHNAWLCSEGTGTNVEEKIHGANNLTGTNLAWTAGTFGGACRINAGTINGYLAAATSLGNLGTAVMAMKLTQFNNAATFFPYYFDSRTAGPTGNGIMYDNDDTSVVQISDDAGAPSGINYVNTTRTAVGYNGNPMLITINQTENGGAFVIGDRWDHAGNSKMNMSLDELWIFRNGTSSDQFLNNWWDNRNFSKLVFGAEQQNNILTITQVHPGNGVVYSVGSGIRLVGNATSTGNLNISNFTFLIWNSTGGLIFNVTNTTVTNVTYMQYNHSIPITLPDGTSSWGISARGSDNSQKFAGNRTIIIDTQGPAINITFPLNISYASVIRALNYTVSDPSLQACWYSTDNGVTNTTITCGNNVTGLSSNAGSNTWLVGANDSLGHVNQSRVTFSVTDQFVLCNATNPIPFINLTFKDEATNTNINGSIDSSTWYYWPTTQSVNKTYSLTNTTLVNPSYAFCYIPAHQNVSVNPTVQYSFTNYPQRRYGDVLSLSNTTTNKVLYLLSTAAGQYVTFQVQTVAHQMIGNVYSTANATIGGTTALISSGYTSDAGLITFWLNPNTDYTFCFSKAGIGDTCTTFPPTLTSYTITLGTGVTVNGTDSTQGVTYTVRPATNVLNNWTSYQFNYTITSSVLTLQEYGFVLKNASGFTLNTSVSGTQSTGETLREFLNTQNQTKIIMYFYWKTNNTYQNYSWEWFVVGSGDTSHSLSRFFSDLRTFVSPGTQGYGIFGITAFSLTLIIFFTIVLITGAISYFGGITSPAAVMSIVTFLTGFFDIGVGLITGPSGAVTHFPTIMMVIATIALIVREVR